MVELIATQAPCEIEVVRSHAAVRGAQRIPALDMTKGVLVLFMVLYHWLNYFVGPYRHIYRYLRFLPPSFIFITGFLISNIYFSKYGIADPRLPKRLVSRGLKTLGIFTILNVLISVLFTGLHVSVTSVVAAYVTGNVELVGFGKVASFYILVPISYLLLLSAGLLIICRRYAYTFHVVCLLFVLSILVLKLNGLSSGALELVTIGLLGITTGYVSLDRINRIMGHSFLLFAVYLCYLGAITVWDPKYPVQVLGVYLTVMLIYVLSTNHGGSSPVPRGLVLLGRYSLFGYIAQIAMLQLLHRGLRQHQLGPVALGGTLFAAVLLTIMAVAALDRARTESTTVDGLYKAVFG